MNAQTEVYISTEPQQALLLEDNKIYEETRFTKNGVTPPATIDNTSPKNDLLALTGSTRESKAKTYIDSAVKNCITVF